MNKKWLIKQRLPNLLTQVVIDEEGKSVEDVQAGETQEEVDTNVIAEEDNTGDGLTTVENSKEPLSNTSNQLTCKSYSEQL